MLYIVATPIAVSYTHLDVYKRQGVDLLLADSTNSEVEGYTQSERTVRAAFQLEFAKTKGGSVGKR